MSKIKWRLVAVMAAVLTVGGIGSRAAWYFAKENIYVFDPAEKKPLPIYCVETKEKNISLTFDVAWENEDMNRVLGILKKEHVKASFFFSGDWVARYPEDVKKIAKMGHDIGNHGNHHKYMTKLSVNEQKNEIQGAQDKVQAVTGNRMDLFRPPYGDYDDQVILTARAMGYSCVQWSVDSLDWMDKGKKNIIDTVCGHKNLKGGAIILCHTGSRYTADALRPMIQNLKHQGFHFVPVSKLIFRKNYYMKYDGTQIGTKK